MIGKVSIEGVRGIREGTLSQLTPLVVLVGPNSSGKSTVLEALNLAGNRDPGAAVGFAIWRRFGLSQGARWLFWKGAERRASVELEGASGATRFVQLFRADQPSSELQGRLVEQRRPGPYEEIRVEASQSAEDAGVWLVGFGSDNAFEIIAPRDSRAKVELLELEMEMPPTWFVDPQRGVPLHDLFSRVVQNNQREVVEELVRSVVPDLDRLEVLTENESPRLHLSSKKRSIPAALEGDGVKAVLRIAMELAALNRDATILLEEPEAHQHPAAIQQCARTIVAAVRRGTQVVLTTHSLELIDALVDELPTDERGLLSLYRLALERGKLVQSRLDGDSVKRSRGEIADDLR